MKIELLYFPSGPNVALARDNLRAALAIVGIQTTWSEVDISAADHDRCLSRE